MRPAARCIAASADKETALTEPGLIVYRFDAPLVFANAAFFVERLEALARQTPARDLKCVVLDAEAISDFDSTAAEALETLDADLERRGVDFWIRAANAPLRELLTATGLMNAARGAAHLSIGARRGGSLITRSSARRRSSARLLPARPDRRESSP